MKYKIFNESIKSVCQNCSEFTTQHKAIIRFGLTVFLFKSLNVFNLSAGTKNLRTNYTFFVNLACFLLIRETRRQGQIFEVDFD